MFKRIWLIVVALLATAAMLAVEIPSTSARPRCLTPPCKPPSTTTTTAAATTTTGASTTSTTVPSATTTAVATTTTSVATTTTVPAGGQAFSETFAGALNAARFTAAYWRNDETGELDPALNGSRILTENGQLRIENGEQNYGDAAVRINQPFDFAGRTGTISFDVSLLSQDGWSRFSLSQDPYAVTSYGDDNAAGQGADRGIDLQFRNFAGCANVILRTYANRVETDLDGPQFPSPCVTASATTLSRVTVSISNSSIMVMSGATMLGNWTGLNLGFTRGYLSLVSHNHATIKYAGDPTWITHWDNVTFDGPALPALNISAATIEGRSLAGVPASPTSPRLIFNAQHGQQDANPTLSYRLNGNAAHAVALQRLSGLTGVYMLSLPVAASELVVGTNTVAFTWTSTSGLPARVADVQLAWGGSSSPPPPTTTVVATTTTAAATTTTTGLPTTTVAPPTGGFVSSMETPEDFFTRFNTDVGNYVDPQHHRTAWLIANLPNVETPHNTYGDHSMACSPPTELRTLDNSDPDLSKYFYWCAPGGAGTGHIMTAFDSSQYVVNAFSPKQSFLNVQNICWNVNATEEGGGKWTNMIVVPEALYQQFAPRMDYVAPDFNQDGGPGDFNIQAVDHPGMSVWGIKDFRGSQHAYVGANQYWEENVVQTTTDKAARYKHCVTRTSSTTSRLTVARPNGTTSTYTLPSAIPQGQVRVIFQDEMYDPPKRDGYDPSHVSWHWDQIEIS